MRRRVPFAVLAVLLLALVVPLSVAHAADDPPELYEYINTGGDGDSDHIATANQTAQKFVSDAESHAVTNIRVPLQRVGDPGYVTLELTTATTGNVSSGVSIAAVTITDTLVPVGSYAWIDFDVSDSGASLEGNTGYVIVVSCPYGDVNNYVLWEKDTGGDGEDPFLLGGDGEGEGDEDDTVGSHSTNAGVTWTLDSPTDYLFEVWGSGVLAIHDVNVFDTYMEDDDWLFVIEYENTYPPYYPTDMAATYFDFQLINWDSDVVAESDVRMWGYRPGSIYLKASEAASLEWGAAYTIRMVGHFGTEPYVDYVLTPADWRGEELSLLDDWIISLALVIGVEDYETMTAFVAGEGEVLNSLGQTRFAVGIPYISTARPDLMEMAVRSPMPTDREDFDVEETDVSTELGAEIVTVIDDGRAFLGVEDTETMGAIIFMAICGAVLAISAVFGFLLYGFGVCYVGLIAATAVGLVDWIYLGAVTFGIVVIWVYIHFSNR